MFALYLLNLELIEGYHIINTLYGLIVAFMADFVAICALLKAVKLWK